MLAGASATEIESANLVTPTMVRERQPLGRDPYFEAICARQTLGLALSGRLTEQLVKRVHKASLCSITLIRVAIQKR